MSTRFVPVVAATLLPALLSGAAIAQTFTRDNGAPVGDNQDSKTAGERGGVLLEDVHLIQKLQRFDRERIPERVVHARGTAAHGVFTATADLSHLTRAKLFSEVGRETPVFVRFSSVIHPSDSPETLHDPRGFAVKFYTEEGNWDLVGNNDAVRTPLRFAALFGRLEMVDPLLARSAAERMPAQFFNRLIRSSATCPVPGTFGKK